ncbi:MAG: hypothetical protein KGJ23_12650 [Euryarchaeota archaeon]|nr:hypothetical protein [Euryarchaeota archaeon]MDE1837448.1 hypothetical protein [Euryarchaeota archaeon]MDE1882011.1 hypothetical protein [Euryarchaeota archaeon]MDE2045586.1 hypothetical protein [Thermoplasmata archaeon]
MPETDRQLAERRLDVWRRAYALIDHRSDFSGPLYDAGYRDVQIEPTLDNESEPDLIAVSDTHFAVLEISCGPNKDFRGLRRYAAGGLTPALRSRFGDRPREPAGSPFFVTNTSGFVSFPNEMNAIRVSDPAECRLVNVSDSRLLEALNRWSGFPGPTPAYGLKALPESSIEEVKFPLAGIIRQVASTGGRVSATEIVSPLLGELSQSVSQAGRARLGRTVATLLERAAFYLKDYARWEAEGRSLVVNVIDNTQARKSFSKALSDWLGTRFLESFSIEPEGNPEEGEDER